jgi:uncharacterized protein YbaR (Trm112 family)
MLPKELLDILCCPKCHGDLLYEPEKNTLTCKNCGKVYPIKNDIPIMIVEEPKDASHESSPEQTR